MKSEMTLTELAEKMFQAYNFYGDTPWKTYDGKDVPAWHHLGSKVQDKWIAAAASAVDALQPAVRKTP